MSTTPQGIIFEPVARRHRAALVGKIAAGTLAVTALAALGVEGASQLSTHGSDAAPLAIAPAPPVVSAADHTTLAAFPATVAHWRAVPAERLAAAVHKAVTSRRAVPAHARAAAAHPAVQHSTSAGATATAAPATQHSAPTPAATRHSSAPAAQHPVSSWHSSWHSSTAADGTVTRVTSKTTTTTGGGHPTTSTHTSTTVTPPASHSAPAPAAPTHASSNADGVSKR